MVTPMSAASLARRHGKAVMTLMAGVGIIIRWGHHRPSARSQLLTVIIFIYNHQFPLYKP
jgi:hypothetical protein